MKSKNGDNHPVLLKQGKRWLRLYLFLSYNMKKKILKKNTCNLPSRVRWMVTHLVECAPLVVIAVMRLSSSSRFSFNFFTRLSMARLAKLSLSPPCRWHIRLWTMLRQASLDVGACVMTTFSVFSSD